MKIYLLSKKFFILEEQAKEDLKNYYFRWMVIRLIISPLECAVENLKGCLSPSEDIPTLFIKTNRYLISNKGS
jgi:hypothetical protein